MITKTRLQEKDKFGEYFLQGLQNFLNLEKEIFPVIPQRIAVDRNDIPVNGARCPAYSHGSAFGPEYLPAFPVKGVWIPEEQCAWAADALTEIPSAFMKESDAGLHFLFLIHPDSESLFQPLLQCYQTAIQHFEAISLSSVRSLLVNIPDANGKAEYFFVKVSLNRVISDSLRVVSREECLSSIGHAIALQTKQLDTLSFVRDICAFIPAGHHINHAAAVKSSKACPQECGMIVREIPAFLMKPQTDFELVPFFALFHDNGLLERMINRSGLTTTAFLHQFLLMPYAGTLIDLLFFHRVSIEAHGQNLLWIVSTKTGLPCQFMYRDMGGVNMLLTEENKKNLPMNLRDASHYYQESHLKDAAESLEWQWVGSVLFNMTKRLVRSESLREDDEALQAWYEGMQRHHFLCNWIVEDDASKYGHQEVISEAQYLRYGYVEELFKKSLIAEIKRRGIPDLLVNNYPYILSVVAEYEKPSVYPDREWFYPFLYTLYSHWLEQCERGRNMRT